VLVSAAVGLALAAVITVGYSASSSERPAQPSMLSFTPRFTVLQDITGDGVEAATATEGAATADAAAEEAVDGAADEEGGRGEGGKWDNTDVGRGLGGKWDISAQEKKVLSPDFAAKYGMAAATASQRMFNQIGVARDGTPVTEAQARSIATRYGMVPVSLAKSPKMMKATMNMGLPTVSYATVPTPMYMPTAPAMVSYATAPSPTTATGPPPGYRIVAGPPQMTQQTVSNQPIVQHGFAALPAMVQPLTIRTMTAEQAADQGQVASDGAAAPSEEASPAEEEEASPAEEQQAPPAKQEQPPPAEEEVAEERAPEEEQAPAAAPEEVTGAKYAPSIVDSATAWGIPLLSGSVVSHQPVMYSGPRVVASPYAMPTLTRTIEESSQPYEEPTEESAQAPTEEPTESPATAIPMGVPAVVAGAARLIPSPASSVFRFASNAPGAAISAAPLGDGMMSVTGMSGVGSEFVVQEGQVVGQGLSAGKGVGQGVEASVAQGDAKGMGITVGSGQEAGYGLSAVSGSAAGDGVVVAKGVAQGRGITVHQGSVAGQGILIGDDGTGHGEFIGSGSGSGTDISVSKGTAVGMGISMAQGQASGDGLTVNAGSVKGSGLAGRQGSGQGEGLSVGSGSVRGTDVRVVQGSVAGQGIYVQHGSLATPS